MNLSKFAEALRLASRSLFAFAEAIEDEQKDKTESLTEMRQTWRQILKQRGSKLE